MLPGKKYQLEDVAWIAWRWKWLLVASFVGVTSLTVLMSRALPDRYRSDELIEVIPQRVSQTYVRPTVTTRVEDRLSSIEQRVMSRTWLERIIQEFNLYPRQRQTGVMEDVIEQMRKDIEVRMIKGDAFRLSYFSRDPRLAMRVTERLASLVINESLQDRSGYADSTTEFLQSQLENAKRQLTEQESKVADYQRRFMGSLPSERQANLQVLQNLQMQVQAVVESINRDKDSRHMVERSLAEVNTEPQAEVPAVNAATDPNAAATGTPAEQLEGARNGLRALLVRLTPDHPDVRRQKQFIAELEAKVAAEAAQRPASDARPATPEQAARQRRVGELRTELARLDLQLQSKEATEKRLRAQIAGLEGRVSVTPLREAEMASLTRDYDTQRKNYESLLAKYEDAKVAANLEHREIGEQFKVLDPARLPQIPVSPNRPVIDMVGALLGLALGVGLVALFEYLDKTIRNESDVTLCLSLPVLAMVPVLDNPGDRKRDRRRRLLLRSGAALVVLGAAAAAAAAMAWKSGWLAVLIS